MATAAHNLSEYEAAELRIDGIERKRFGIVVSDWNPEVTTALLNGAVDTLSELGARKENIFVKHVPGSFELVYGAKQVIERYTPDAVIVLGCVIQGDTPHFTYVCQGVTQGITSLNTEGQLPVIYGLLTTLNQQQALDRAGGKLGNKGVEAAVTAIRMIQTFP